MAAGNNTPRIVAVILALTFFALIGAFVTMAMISRDEVRLNAIGPLGPAAGVERGGVRFSGTVHVWEVVGSVGTDHEGNAQLSLNLRGPNGQPPDARLQLAAAFARPDSEAAPIEAPLRRVGQGVYEGRAALGGDGAWRLRLIVPEVTGVLAFTVDP
ncbi:MAG: FixH family protein [Zoogloeaceae bacterium]|nr:FixH family protein [Zoogloeaceae bacterium]